MVRPSQEILVPKDLKAIQAFPAIPALRVAQAQLVLRALQVQVESLGLRDPRALSDHLAIQEPLAHLVTRVILVTLAAKARLE